VAVRVDDANAPLVSSKIRTKPLVVNGVVTVAMVLGMVPGTVCDGKVPVGTVAVVLGVVEPQPGGTAHVVVQRNEKSVRSSPSPMALAMRSHLGFRRATPINTLPCS